MRIKLVFCHILLTLLAFTSLAQAQDVPETLVYEQTQAVGAVGDPPDPNPFYINPTTGTLASRVVWEDNKQLETGPDSLGVIIHGVSKGGPFVGVLLDAGLNPIPGTEFAGIVGLAAPAQIDLAETTRFSGVYIGLGNADGFTSPWMFYWTGTPLTVVDGEAVGDQPPAADAGPDVSGTEGVAVQFQGGQSSDADGSIANYLWEFGDGTTGTEINPVHTYSVASTYNVTLTVTDNQGAIDSDTTIATIASTNNPPAAFAGGEIDASNNRTYTGTAGAPVQFDGSGSTDDVGIVRYEWNFADQGATGTSVAPQYTYDDPGTYSVALEVFDDQGESDVDYVNAEISQGNQAPTAEAGPPVAGTTGDAVQFNGSASNDPDGTDLVYDWFWDDGTQNSDVGSSPQHTYSRSGDYTVILTVTDAGGISASDTTSATIDHPPTIPPRADAGGFYGGTAGVPKTFDGRGSTDFDGTVDGYFWDFGDGVGTGMGGNPSYTYADSGTYTVILTVTDNDSNTDTDTALASIASPANQAPTADAGGTYSGVVGTAVDFDGSGSSDPEGGSLEYDWQYGDGATGTGVNPSHTYSMAELPATVTLTVTDEAGVSDTTTTSAQISEDNQSPTADASGPYTGTVGEAVAFDGSGSSDPDGTVDAYLWDFGDNVGTSTDAAPNYAYAAAGNYTVTLTVTDDDGATSPVAHSTTTIDSTNASPVADPGGPYTNQVDLPSTFDGTASMDPNGAIIRYDWQFGDGSPLGQHAGPIPTHIYTAADVYDVTLTVTDNEGASSTAATQINIGEGTNYPPTANPGGNVEEYLLYKGETGESVFFNGSASSDSDGEIVDYYWEFGEGGTGSGATFQYTYSAAGSWIANLTVTDNGGKTDTLGVNVLISQGNLAPTAVAGGPYDGIVDQGIAFKGSDSSDPDGTIDDYHWEFGDPNDLRASSTLMNPRYQYDDPGTYTVTLTVTDNLGATNTATTQAVVGATLIPPTAEAGGPQIGKAGAPVTFDGTDSYDPDGTITDYDWTFGDGNTGTGQTPDHTHGEGSRYHVTLQVTDDDGLRNSDGTTARIGQFSQPPTAAPGGPYNGRVDAHVTFDGTASDDPDGRIKKYDWDFGDGTNGRGKAPRHRYRADGVYPVALTVTDNTGETDTQVTVVTIGIGNLPPEADAGDTVTGKAGGKIRGKAGRKVTFDGTGSSDPDGIIRAYHWDFGDGSTGKGRKPRHAYAKAGAYRVTLKVTDNQGATASDVTLAVIEPIGD